MISASNTSEQRQENFLNDINQVRQSPDNWKVREYCTGKTCDVEGKPNKVVVELNGDPFKI